jgi:REP element-mobilizing transposase RayT
MREGCAVHAYVLMTNHVHLLMTPTAAGQIARVLQGLGRPMCAMSTIEARIGRPAKRQY